ncbi:unnamed protein product, partial [marine sediment metagenome]
REKNLRINFPAGMSQQEIESIIKFEVLGEKPAVQPLSDFTSPEEDLRADATEKGPGYFGELKLPGGEVATEYSIGVNFDGKETQIPTLVPTLTKEELALMQNEIIPENKPIPQNIIDKAIAHARERTDAGKSPFEELTLVERHRKGPTAKEAVRGLEAIPALAAGMGGTIAGGLAALAELLPDEFTQRETPRSIDERITSAGEKFERVTGALSYQPRTKEGQRALETLTYPLQKLKALDDAIGAWTLDTFKSPFLAALAASTPEALLVLSPFIGKWAKPVTRIKQSAWWRMKTIPETQVAVLKVGDLMNKGK